MPETCPFARPRRVDSRVREFDTPATATRNPGVRSAPRANVTKPSHDKTKQCPWSKLDDLWGDINAPPDHPAVCHCVAVVRRNRLRAGQPAPQSHAVRAGRLARPDRDAADRAGDGRRPRQGRQFQEFALAVSDLHHRQRLGAWRPATISATPATSATRSIPAIRSGRRRHRHPVPRNRSGARAMPTSISAATI